MEHEMDLKSMLANKAAIAPSTVSPEEHTEVSNIATGLMSTAEAVKVAPAAEPPKNPTPKPAVAIDPKKPIRYQKMFTHRIMAGGFFYPADDGFYYPETPKQKQACEHLAKQQMLAAENYSPAKS